MIQISKFYLSFFSFFLYNYFRVSMKFYLGRCVLCTLFSAALGAAIKCPKTKGVNMYWLHTSFRICTKYICNTNNREPFLIFYKIKGEYILILTLFCRKEIDEVLLRSAICSDDLNNLASISGLVTRGVCCCWGNIGEWIGCTK